MNAQEVFNKVATHLLTQKSKSVYEELCKYRAPGGRQCAVGCLIPDDEYQPAMEGLRVHVLLNTYPALEARLGEHKDLLKDLQFLHDSTHIKRWPISLIGIAAKDGSIVGPLAEGWAA